jgi:hypothetical protein
MPAVQMMERPQISRKTLTPDLIGMNNLLR